MEKNPQTPTFYGEEAAWYSFLVAKNEVFSSARNRSDQGRWWKKGHKKGQNQSLWGQEGRERMV